MKGKGKAATSNRRSLLFLARFVALLLGFYFVVASHPVNDAVIVPFTAGVARICAVILSAIGENVAVAGTEIRSGDFAVNIENGCNGVEAALLFGSAILAFPAPWRRRALGLVTGFAAIQALNFVRVVSLFWIGAHRPVLFSSSHTVLWQSAVVLFSVLLFLFWASREQRTRAAETVGEHGPSPGR
jgi:exosortase H (IPTLxxWG-CTERM-specific)